MIRELLNENDYKNSVQIIIESFKTVADEFKLTEENCPTHPSFITYEKLKELKEKGLRFFGLFEENIFNENKQVGLIAIEKADDTLYYLEKLAVIPGYRNKGYGKKLMDFAFDFIKSEEGKFVSIAIIDKSKILKKWYMDYGFIEREKKDFQKLPFTVCFLEKEIN